MGAFIDNCHVYTRSLDTLKSDLSRMIAADAYVTKSGEEWVSIYVGESESPDDIARKLSSSLNTGALAFNVHDSDVFRYVLYEKGIHTDGYVSNLDYFDGGMEEDVDAEEIAADEIDGMTGNPGALIKYTPRGRTEKAIQDALDAAREATFAEDGLARLAELIGIDPQCARSCMRYLPETGYTIERRTLELVRPS